MNLRVIKKDVNYLIDEFLNDALDLRDETLTKISHPEGDKKTYYRNLMDGLLSSLDVMYDKLSEAVSKKSE